MDYKIRNKSRRRFLWLNNGYRVKLNNVDEVKQFVEVMREYKGDVDVSAANKNYMVDGKSILGVISLVLTMN